ncbi:hypothetical protein KUTeg_011189, partial [Tegillarca granosa]
LDSTIGRLNITGGPDKVSLKELHTNSIDDGYLKLNPYTRDIILIKPLDTDASDTYPARTKLVFKVQCNVTSGSFASIVFTVTVLLEDYNDNGPIFNRTHHKVIVPEDYFDIPLSIFPSITLKKTLDYEQVKQMIIEIKAVDIANYGPQRSATATLTVYIADVDDHNPVFTSYIYSAIISSDTAPVNPYMRYEINSSTGVLKVRTLLEVTTDMLMIRATQSNIKGTPATAILKIQITWPNSDGPRFTQLQYNARVSENEPIGATVLTVSAKDGDVGDMITYGILERQSTFTIDQSGNIALAEDVDFERKREYHFNVTASDGLHVGLATVHVNIVNVNDNNPVLETPSEIKVNLERIKGTVVTKIKAVDKDFDSVLRYQLLTNPGLFSISPEGEITLRGSDEDYDKDQYYLFVIVGDSGSPERSTFAVVIVNFPPLKFPAGQGVMTDDNDLLAIVFGAVAAFLLIIIIILIVYIIRRHAYTKEQLNKARLHKGRDPQGLTYRAGDTSPTPPGLDFNYNGDLELEETSDIDAIEGITGATSIQENPLSDDNINYGFANHPNEGIAENGEIQLDTAVIPYNEDYYNTIGSKHSYHNGSLRTFHTPEGSSSGDSNHSDSTGDSNKGLMKPSIRSSLTKGKKLLERNGRVPAYNSDTYLETEKKSKKSKEKPEITVYF